MKLISKIAIFALVILGLVACGQPDPNVAGVSGKTVTSGTANIGGPFSLIDTNGTRVDESLLEGRPHLVYFGFAFCPDVCPTALQKLGAAQDLLGEAGDEIGYILIPVDPERDTPEKLGQYITFEPFPTGLRGLTGTVEEVETAKTAYKVFSQKVPLEGGDYTVDHVDMIFLIGSDGKFVDFFTSRSTPQDIAIRVRQVLMEND